jgi:hypothetical protein
MSAICKHCLVELQDDMKRCPLCGTDVNDSGEAASKSDDSLSAGRSYMEDGEKHLLQRILWQVTATLLFSGIAATLIIDLARHDWITWSIYPVAICLMVLSYASLFAFWQAKTLYRILAGWLLSTLLLIALHRVVPLADWTVGLGIPLIFAINCVTVAFLAVYGVTKRKGLNLLAYSIVAVAVLCISIEGIISRYHTGIIHLGWSVIVAACLLPVSVALLFMFFRTRNNPKLQKIFHT